MGQGLGSRPYQNISIAVYCWYRCFKQENWLQVNVKAKSAFNNKLFALNVVISIPVPDNTAKADIQTTQGMNQQSLY